MRDEWTEVEERPGFRQAMQDKEWARAYGASKGAEELGKIVERLRRERGLSQEAMAKQIGSSQACLSRVENGRVADVGLDLLRRIGWALGLEARVEFSPWGDRGSRRRPGPEARDQRHWRSGSGPVGGGSFPKDPGRSS